METLVYLDGAKLSDVNRKFVQKPIHILDDIRTASGLLRRDFTATKYQFSFRWSDLPWNTSDVPDGGASVSGLAALDPSTTHALRIYKESGAPEYDDYTVYLGEDSPEMNLNERRSDAWWYEVNLDLVEQ